MLDGQKSKCKKCGLTIRRFTVLVGKGQKRTGWFALIKGEWNEACPTSFFFEKPHKVGSDE